MCKIAIRFREEKQMYITAIENMNMCCMCMEPFSRKMKPGVYGGFVMHI